MELINKKYFQIETHGTHEQSLKRKKKMVKVANAY